jgi:hypothetical protein
MRWLLDVTVAFLALGAVEAVVKPLARRFVQRRILSVAPLLFRQLDPLLPGLLQRCTGAELEQVVRQKLETLTGESWTSDDLEPLFALFDPRAAADHAVGQMGDAILNAGFQRVPMLLQALVNGGEGRD